MNSLCLLAIEASSEQLSIAAQCGARRELLELRPARDHSARVYEYVTRVLEAVGADYQCLDGVAFGCGPGSFTGVRIAAAAVQAIASARAIPVCRVSSLAVLAAGAARRFGDGHLGRYAICQDARMGHAYAGFYQAMGNATDQDAAQSIADAAGVGELMRPLMSDVLVEPANWSFPGAEPFVGLGDGWDRLSGVRERHAARLLSVQSELLPSALDLLDLALADWCAGRTVRAQEALPEYLGQMPAQRAIINDGR